MKALLLALVLGQDFPGVLGEPVHCLDDETVARCLERQGLTGAVDAPHIDGTPDAGFAVVDVRRARMVQADGGLVAVTDGVWLSTDELRRIAADRRDLRTRNEFLVEHAADVQTRWILAGVVVGLVGGAAMVTAAECSLGNCFGLKR